MPVVIADRMDGKTEVNPQFTPDYIYAGRALPEQRAVSYTHLDVYKRQIQSALVISQK